MASECAARDNVLEHMFATRSFVNKVIFGNQAFQMFRFPARKISGSLHCESFGKLIAIERVMVQSLSVDRLQSAPSQRLLPVPCRMHNAQSRDTSARRNDVPKIRRVSIGTIWSESLSLSGLDQFGGELGIAASPICAGFTIRAGAGSADEPRTV